MAYTHPQHGTGEDAKLLRRKAGNLLKELRLSRDMTQKELAEKVGFPYYTMISQIESGATRLPPAQMVAYAEALNIPARELVRLVLQYYDPITFDILFTNKYD